MMHDKPSKGSIAIALLLLIPVGYAFFSFWTPYSNGSRDPPFDPLAHCASNYGLLLGYAHKIPAFSNCHRDFHASTMILTRFGEPNTLLGQNDGNPGTFISGTPWDSSEYVARFLFHHKAITFIGVQEPHGVWSLPYFLNPVSGDEGRKRRAYTVLRFQNPSEVITKKDRKRHAPKFADIIVWLAHPKRALMEGHMAVVVDVQDDVEAAGGAEQLQELREKRLQPLLVYIAEQNFDNTDWGGRNYSRILRFKWKDGKEAYMEDSSGLKVLGHMRIGSSLIENNGDDSMRDGDL